MTNRIDMNISRDSVFVGIPTIDRKIDIGTMMSIMSCMQWWAQFDSVACQSNICLARNCVASIFLKSNREWFQLVDADIIFSQDDWALLWEGDEEIVVAPYARKVLGEPPAEFGLGFCRVHRSVFEKIEKLTTDDGRDYAGKFVHRGTLMTNFYPNGPTEGSRFVPEDYGFFTLARLTDAKPRLENRCRLRHVGLIEYGYPDQIPGWQKIETNEGAN